MISSHSDQHASKPMANTPSGADSDSSMLKQLGWMAAIWGMSVAVIGTVAYIIRLWLL